MKKEKHRITRLIKSKMNLLGLSTDDLSERLSHKYKGTYLSTLINGGTGFPLDFLYKISKGLEIDLQTLIDLKDEKH